jgi:hypothetical protein
MAPRHRATPLPRRQPQDACERASTRESADRRMLGARKSHDRQPQEAITKSRPSTALRGCGRVFPPARYRYGTCDLVGSALLRRLPNGSDVPTGIEESCRSRANTKCFGNVGFRRRRRCISSLATRTRWSRCTSYDNLDDMRLCGYAGAVSKAPCTEPLRMRTSRPVGRCMSGGMHSPITRSTVDDEPPRPSR